MSEEQFGVREGVDLDDVWAQTFMSEHVRPST